MPRSEMSSAVSLLPEQLGKGDFLPLHVTGIGKIDSISVGVTPGEDAASWGRADRSGCIEAIKAHSGIRHFVEVRGLNCGVPVKSSIPPTEIIAHY